MKEPSQIVVYMLIFSLIVSFSIMIQIILEATDRLQKYFKKSKNEKSNSSKGKSRGIHSTMGRINKVVSSWEKKFKDFFQRKKTLVKNIIKK